MKKISQKDCFKFSGKREAIKELAQHYPYKKPMLQYFNTSANMIAGGSTSNQLENSSGLIES
jgi:hypothetical protein